MSDQRLVTGRNELAWRSYYQGVTRWLPILQNRHGELAEAFVFEAWKYRYASRATAIRSLTVIEKDLIQRRNRAKWQTSHPLSQERFLSASTGEQRTQEYLDDLQLLRTNRPEYGPLLQWFVRQGLGDASILDWALRIPPLIDEYRRHENGKEIPIPELRTSLVWKESNDLDHPWKAILGGEQWRLRLNDFPDEKLYTLFIEDKPIASFNDFPSVWKRRRSTPPARPSRRVWVLTPGHVIQFELPDGRFAYGRLYGHSISIYRQLTNEPATPPIGSRDFLFNVVYFAIPEAHPSVGFDAFDDTEDPEGPCRYLQTPDRKFHLTRGNSTRGASAAECSGLELLRLWHPAEIVERILEGETCAACRERWPILRSRDGSERCMPWSQWDGTE